MFDLLGSHRKYLLVLDQLASTLLFNQTSCQLSPDLIPLKQLDEHFLFVFLFILHPFSLDNVLTMIFVGLLHCTLVLFHYNKL
ncbi:hypothetical protein GDO86_001639 [Hymenochirus boettgeri]|uniref:Uncharacterized protein n=1 Tax=Hymenochirus boettgeri TaxID=247094 RepID=A0A8T2KJ60_9PIPI|nr:hypothetical protein GDO86_001639 [Hymenochirus boettgeri]